MTNNGMSNSKHDPHYDDGSERESLEFELEQAREDDRDAWSRTWQAIVAGVTAIAIVLAMYSEIRPDDGNAWPIPPECFLVLVLLVAVATYSYVASTAVISSLRYQFMREIEGRLIKLSDGRVPRWKHLSSPVETYNILHVNSSYAVSHYTNLAIAVIATTGFLAVTVWVFFRDLQDSIAADIILTVFSLSVALFFATVILASVCTSNMYKYAKDRMDERLKSEDKGGSYNAENKRRNAIWAVAYYLYPRPMDFAKVLYIVLGIALGAAVSGALEKDAFGLVPGSMLALTVFDGLVYQSRYQWNDIRGAVEDDNNPESAKRARLPKDIVELRPAIILSVLFGIFKLVLAAELIAAFETHLGQHFSLFCILVFVLGIMYEKARALDCVTAVVFLVTLGYPLRVAAGMAVGLAAGNMAFCDVSGWMLLVVMLSASFFGLSFVGITWALEGCDFMRLRRTERHRYGGVPSPYKSHVMWMYGQVGSTSGERYPLRPRGRIATAWNAGIVLSLALMCAYTALTTWANPCVLLLCLLYAGVLLYGIFSNGRRAVGMVLVAAIMVGVLVLLCAGRTDLLGGAEKAVILFSVGAYLAVYLSFRATNYAEMTGALDSVIKCLAKLTRWVQVHLLGEKTVSELRKERQSSTKE